MIFVTVGTHEQQFNRLVKEIDQLVSDGIIKEKVVMQIGYSTYVPKYCEWHKLLSYTEMLENITAARIIITHGGPASFMMPLQMGKVPIVVPRQLAFNEHINNHQVDFIETVAERIGNIVAVYDIANLKKTIQDYNNICKNIVINMKVNNEKFNIELGEIVRKMFPEGYIN